MKTPIVLLLILSLSVFSCIGRVVVDKPGAFKITKEKYSFIQEYESPDNIHLSLSTVGGNIEVKGYDGNRVKVAFVVTKNNGEVLEMTLDELQKYATFVIVKEGSELSIQVKDILRRNMSVGFIVQTPVNTTCSITTSGGNLDLERLKGNQKMRTSGGNIDIEEVTGNLEAHTSGGNISMEKLTGVSKVSTSGGNIDGENILGDLFAETSGGNIHLENHTGLADVSTSGGNISLDDMSGSVSARTSGGNVHAMFKTLTNKLNLETNGGSIECTLPWEVGMDLTVSGSEIKTTLTNFQGTSKSDYISGQLNGGGIPVRINCPGGTIRLKFNKLSDNQ
jgi:hypothetical protein